MFQHFMNNRRLIIVVILVLICLSFSTLFKSEIKIAKRYSDTYGGEITNIINDTKKLNKKYYDVGNIPFYNNEAPSMYREYRNENNIIQKYWYISITEKSIDEVFNFFREYYSNEFKFLDRGENATTFTLNYKNYNVIVMISKSESSTVITFDAYK